jgi:hypothetical protein
VSNIAFLLIAVALSVIGTIALWFYHRTPSSWDSGIDEFSRNMKALTPAERKAARRRSKKGNRRR